MKTTTFKAAMLALTAMTLFATLLTAAPNADAKVAEHDRSMAIAGRTTNGGNGASCPEGSIGEPGGCFVYVSKLLVLTFDNYWMYICPSDSVEDSLGRCRKPVADVPPPGSYSQFVVYGG